MTEFRLTQISDTHLARRFCSRASCEFRLRLPAEPSRSGRFGQFGPWHLADRVALPNTNGALDTSTHDAFAIRYRVI